MAGRGTSAILSPILSGKINKRFFRILARLVFLTTKLSAS
jgi:hypothetical protein